MEIMDSLYTTVHFYAISSTYATTAKGSNPDTLFITDQFNYIPLHTTATFMLLFPVTPFTTDIT